MLKRRHEIVIVAVVLFSIFGGKAQAHYPTDFSAPLKRIAFGSCNKQNLPQTIWPAITRSAPDLWVWMGDNVYADATELAKIEATYAVLLANPSYSAFRAATPIVGTWDDHDYGVNDGGKDFALKDDSQQLLLRFLDEPLESSRWRQRGVYTTTSFGPPGKRVQLFLLDERYFRDQPGKTSDILGDEQWAWLGKELAASDAQLKLLVSGTQVILNVPFGEVWGDYPRARARLYQLIRGLRVGGVIILSGDKHLGVIDSLGADQGVGYPLYDVTASGLTHAVTGATRVAARLLYGARVYTDKNFGSVEVDWDSNPVRVKLNIHDAEGRVVRTHGLNLDELQPQQTRL